MSDVRVKYLDQDSTPAWEAFVEAAPGASFFHRAGWKTVIERSFGHRCHYLYTEQNGTVTGILPLVHINSKLFGKSLISNAYCVSGGPVTEAGASAAALDEEALKLARDLGVDYLEYRAPHAADDGWVCESTLYAGFRKQLTGDSDKDLAAIPRKRRAMIRKAIGSSLTSDAERNVDGFFALYAESVRNLGTPVFARRYFHNLAEVFGDDCEILTVRSNGQALSSVLSFCFRDTVLPYYGGGSPQGHRLAANDFMYWEVMRRAGERGLRCFDFGRSKRGTGAFDYKCIWGFEPEPLSYSYRLFGLDALPEVNPTNPKYRLAIALWRRLPLFAANTIGPLIARDLG